MEEGFGVWLPSLSTAPPRVIPFVAAISGPFCLSLSSFPLWGCTYEGLCMHPTVPGTVISRVGRLWIRSQSTFANTSLCGHMLFVWLLCIAGVPLLRRVVCVQLYKAPPTGCRRSCSVLPLCQQCRRVPGAPRPCQHWALSGFCLI